MAVVEGAVVVVERAVVSRHMMKFKKGYVNLVNHVVVVVVKILLALI